MPGKTPIAIGGQVHHLMDDGVADPGALLASRAIDERIVRVQLDGADARLEDTVQLVVIAREARALLPRIHLFPHGEVLQRDRALCPVHQRVGVTEPIRVEDLESVVLSARDIPGSGVLSERTGGAAN